MTLKKIRTFLKNNQFYFLIFISIVLIPWVFEKDFFQDKVNDYFIWPVANNISIYGWVTILIIFIIIHIKVVFGSKTHISVYYLIVSIVFPTIVYCLYNEKIYGNYIILNKESKILLVVTVLLMLAKEMICNITKLSYKLSYINIETKTNKNGFLIENAINSLDEDEFRRKPFILNLIGLIENTECRERSFNIAVTGDWGSGKTSLLNILEKKFQSKPDEYITIKYDPWVNHDEKLIPKEFIRTILNSIDSSDELYDWFTRYLELLNEDNTNTWLKSAQTVLQFGQEKRSLQIIKKEITNYLFNEKKKLIIFIDDLDRLEANEIMDIIRLIRNSADFGSTFYILGFDYTYVISQINDILKNKAETFLQKIFNLRVDLPQIENKVFQSILKNSFIEELNLSISADLHKVKTGFESEEELNKLWIMHWEIKTKRDLINIINNYKLIKSCLKEDCNDEILINLEIIRYYYPNLYQYTYTIIDEIRDPKENALGENQRKWEYLLTDYHSEIPNKEIALDIYFYLFKDVYFENSHNFKISELPKYFVYSILAGQLKKKEFEDIISNQKYSIEQAHDLILSKNAVQDYNLKLSKNEFEAIKILDTQRSVYLFKLQLKLISPNKSYLSFYENTAEYKLLIELQKHESGIDEIVDYLLKNAEFPYTFESLVFKEFSKANFISEDISIQKQIDLFNKFLSENKIIENVKYYRIHFWAMNTFEKRINMDQKLSSLLEDLAVNNPIIILYIFIFDGIKEKELINSLPNLWRKLKFEDNLNEFDNDLMLTYKKWLNHGSPIFNEAAIKTRNTE